MKYMKKPFKPGQLVTINHNVFRIIALKTDYCCIGETLHTNKYVFCAFSYLCSHHEYKQGCTKRLPKNCIFKHITPKMRNNENT